MIAFLLLNVFVLIVLLFTAYQLRMWWYHGKNQPIYLPPGPKRYPLVGNLFNAPSANNMWLSCRDLSRKYNSDIVYMNIAGNSTLIVNSAKAAEDLLVDRASIYSSRPRTPMLSEVLGWHWNFGLMPLGKEWSAIRTMFQKLVRRSELKTYLFPCIEARCRKVLLSLLESPEEFYGYTRLLAGDAILSTAYGIEVNSKDDEIIRIAEHAMHVGSVEGAAGKHLVDIFPVLQYVPSWFPGMGFKRLGNVERKYTADLLEIPFEQVKREMENGRSISSSMVSRQLQQLRDEGTWTAAKEDALKKAVGVMYAAGSDTTVSIIYSIFLAMTQNPEIMKKGQIAIDNVVSHDRRLPNIADRGKAPYIDAIVREALRWHPTLPLGVPHYTTSADVYKEYYIPKNTTVISNIWAILHDEEIYGPDTDIFRPERFLDKDGNLNPAVPSSDAAFGYGKRICAGKRIAESVVWIIVASVLSCFDIKPVTDDNGLEIKPTGEYTDGMLIYPVQFKCEIRPRSIAAATLIRESVL